MTREPGDLPSSSVVVRAGCPGSRWSCPPADHGPTALLGRHPVPAGGGRRFPAPVDHRQGRLVPVSWRWGEAQDIVVPQTDRIDTPTRTAVTLSVCVTCGSQASPDTPPGRVLHAAVRAAAVDAPMIAVRPVECLSACRRSCAVAVSAPGKWSYVWADLDPETDVAAIIDGVRRYAEAPDGIVPWRERPEPLRRGIVARIPPLVAA